MDNIIFGQALFMLLIPTLLAVYLWTTRNDILKEKNEAQSEVITLGAKNLNLENKIAATNQKVIDISMMFLGMGHDLFAKKDYKGAVESFTQAIDSAPPKKNITDVFRARASAYHRLSQNSTESKKKQEFQEKMLKDYETWVSTEPVASRHIDVAEALVDAKEFERAKDQIDFAAQRTKVDGLSDYAKSNALGVVTRLSKNKYITDEMAQKWKDVFEHAPSPKKDKKR